MKKIISLLLAFIMIFSAVAMVACKDDQPKKTTPNNNDGPDQPGEEIEIPLVKDKKANVYIVLPEKSSNKVTYARDAVKYGIEKITDVSVLSGVFSTSDYEILIGNTGKEESNQVLAELGEGEFAVKTIGNKIVIAAHDEGFLYEAATQFVKKCLGEEYSNNDPENLTITHAIDITMDGDTESNYYKIVNNARLGGSVSHSIVFEHKEYVKTDKTKPYRTQGGVFTGEYVFQGLINYKEDQGQIIKYDVKTGEVSYSEIRNDLGHINDLTYNERTNEVLIGGGTRLVVFDADTLEYKRTITNVPIPAGGATHRVTYSAARDQYVVAQYGILNSSLKGIVKKFAQNEVERDTVTQGIGCDDIFIYSLCPTVIGSDKYITNVVVYDWSGNFVSYITLEVPNYYEPENISCVDGELYIEIVYPLLPNIYFDKVQLRVPEY